MIRALLACFALFGIAACASRPPAMPPNVSIVSGGSCCVRIPSPPAVVAANDAAPEIVYMAFNTLDVHRLGHGTPNAWSGSFTTSTNVASVEVRTNLFSINAPRKAFGHFAFTAHVVDLPPIFVRPYRLRVIARNSAGVAYEEDLPFSIH